MEKLENGNTVGTVPQAMCNTLHAFTSQLRDATEARLSQEAAERDAFSKHLERLEAIEASHIKTCQQMITEARHAMAEASSSAADARMAKASNGRAERTPMPESCQWQSRRKK